MLQRKLGQRIAELRRNRQLTQKQLAKALGCTVEFINLVERGVNRPSIAGLEKLAQALTVDVRQLFTFKPASLRRRTCRGLACDESS